MIQPSLELTPALRSYGDDLRRPGPELSCNDALIHKIILTLQCMHLLVADCDPVDPRGESVSVSWRN